jgi:hypothetical protein
MLPFYFGIRLVTVWGQGLSEEVCAFLIHIPTFYIASTYVLPDWLDYTMASAVETLLVRFILGVPQIPLNTHLGVLGFLIFLFACQEKSRKESWVISHTNAKTKKILMGLLNQQPSPICIVTAQKGGPAQANGSSGG